MDSFTSFLAFPSGQWSHHAVNWCHPYLTT